MTKFDFNINLETHIKSNDIIKNYPNISKQEIELISWNIYGNICISYGDVILTQNLNTKSNYIGEYLWYFLTQLHMQMPKIMKKEDVIQDFFDNPDTLSFIPEGNAVKVIFECGCKNHKSYQEIIVSIEDVFSALLNSTKKLVDELLLLNPKLENTIEVETLIEAYEKTMNLLIDYS